MNAREFAKRRAKIGNQVKRAARWHRQALERLIREAQAVPVVRGVKVMGYRLPNGEIICNKQRFKTEAAAIETLGMIAREEVRDHKPIRAYPCYQCQGWHVTSEHRENGQAYGSHQGDLIGE